MVCNEATEPEDIGEEPKRRRELNELTEGAAVASCESCEVSPSQLKRGNNTGKFKIKTSQQYKKS